MDVLAHTLWTNVVFRAKYKDQRRLRYLAVFFGVAPDFVGFTPIVVYAFYKAIINGQLPKIGQSLFLGTDWTARFAVEAYNYTHSLVVFLVCFLLVMLVGNLIKYWKDSINYKFWFFWPMLGWPFHILIDIFTHPSFYQTPFLFPISGFKNHYAISWADPIFMIVNYSCIALVYFGIFYFQRKKRIILPQ